MKYLIAGVLLLIIINIPPVNWIFQFADHQDIDYANSSGTFTFSEMNGKERNFLMCSNRWNSFKQTSQKDTVLYRITPRNYFHIWNLGDYLFAEKYHYPYKEIIIRRPGNFLHSGYQDF